MQQPRVALVIPAWNEAESIGAVLQEIPPGAVDATYVVCGHSRDSTADIAREHGAVVVDDNAIGYGAACWSGARAATRDGAGILAFLDGDYSDPPAALPDLLAPVLAGQADLTLGSRDMREHPDALPPHARLGNTLVLNALRLALGRRLLDLPSFKVIPAACLDALAMTEMTYGWTTELIVKAARAGFCIVEVPIGYRPRLGGQSKVSGTIRGTLGAAWKLSSCAIRYARWSPPSLTSAKSTHA